MRGLMKSPNKAKFILLLFLSYVGHLQSMTLVGTIQNCDQIEISVNILFGRFHFRSDNIKVPIDKKGRFVTHILVDEIRIGELQISDVSIPIFLKSSADTLFVSLDWSDKEHTLQFQEI
jgi:hypothetical protein